MSNTGSYQKMAQQGNQTGRRAYRISAWTSPDLGEPRTPASLETLLDSARYRDVGTSNSDYVHTSPRRHRGHSSLNALSTRPVPPASHTRTQTLSEARLSSHTLLAPFEDIVASGSVGVTLRSTSSSSPADDVSAVLSQFQNVQIRRQPPMSAPNATNSSGHFLRSRSSYSDDSVASRPIRLNEPAEVVQSDTETKELTSVSASGDETRIHSIADAASMVAGPSLNGADLQDLAGLADDLVKLSINQHSPSRDSRSVRSHTQSRPHRSGIVSQSSRGALRKDSQAARRSRKISGNQEKEDSEKEDAVPCLPDVDETHRGNYLACPFHVKDHVKYWKCRGLALKTMGDVVTHVRGKHACWVRCRQEYVTNTQSKAHTLSSRNATRASIESTAAPRSVAQAREQLENCALTIHGAECLIKYTFDDWKKPRGIEDVEHWRNFFRHLFQEKVPAHAAFQTFSDDDAYAVLRILNQRTGVLTQNLDSWAADGTLDASQANLCRFIMQTDAPIAAKQEFTSQAVPLHGDLGFDALPDQCHSPYERPNAGESSPSFHSVSTNEAGLNPSITSSPPFMDCAIQTDGRTERILVSRRPQKLVPNAASLVNRSTCDTAAVSLTAENNPLVHSTFEQLDCYPVSSEGMNESDFAAMLSDPSDWVGDFLNE